MAFARDEAAREAVRFLRRLSGVRAEERKTAMNPTTATVAVTKILKEEAQEPSQSRSVNARGRMEGQPLEPLFLADWKDVVMLHFEVKPERLQRLTTLELDRFEGRAFVSLVAFRMERMRLRCLPRLSEPLLAPFTKSLFLNLRTYVRHGDDVGVQFLVEWLSNRLSVPLGPPVYGLPYRNGELQFTTHGNRRAVQAKPRCGCGLVDFEVEPLGVAEECEPGTREEFLAERYTAFTECRGRRRCFRIWHPPWRQRRCRVLRAEQSLLGETFAELAGAHLVAATFSGGLEDVWMGKPERLN